MVMNVFRRQHKAENYPGHPHYVIGLDVGQAADYTALVVMERILKRVGSPFSVRAGMQLVGWGPRAAYAPTFKNRQPVENHYIVRHMERPPLRTPYTKVADGVLERIRKLCPADLYPEGAEVVLVVDATGVGRGIVDMLYSKITTNFGKSDPTVALWPVTITGGTGRAKAEGGWITLPKTELIHTGGVIPLQDGRLKWGPGIPERDDLERELSNYRKKVNIATASTQFEPWRESDHDDLLFALCLAGWGWKHYQLKYVTDDISSEATPEPVARTPITGEPLPPLP